MGPTWREKKRREERGRDKKEVGEEVEA